MLTAFSMPPEANMLKPITCHNGLRGGPSGSLLLYEGSTIRPKISELTGKGSRSSFVPLSCVQQVSSKRTHPFHRTNLLTP